MKICIFLSTVLLLVGQAFAMEPWEVALSKMPLATNVTELNRTNCVPLLLNSFQKNDDAKALILMPGATDELYFFKRVNAKLTNSSPTLLDAIVALTNQSLIRVDYRAPFVLIHSNEDPLEPVVKVNDIATADRIKKRKFQKHIFLSDKDWPYLHPILRFELDAKIAPFAASTDANHFYRHSFAAWNLNGFEAIEAIALAGKTIVTIEKRRVIFEGDIRFRARPPVPVLQ